jgi:hypothetical protein
MIEDGIAIVMREEDTRQALWQAESVFTDHRRAIEMKIAVRVVHIRQDEARECPYEKPQGDKDINHGCQ